MELRQCKRCKIEYDITTYHTQLLRGTIYIHRICRSCNNAQKRIYNKSRKTPLRIEFRDCVIRDNNKEYYTSKLSESEIIELKEMGYSFIFRR